MNAVQQQWLRKLSKECLGLICYLLTDLVYSYKCPENSHVPHTQSLSLFLTRGIMTWGIGVPILYQFTVFLLVFGWLELKFLHQSVMSWVGFFSFGDMKFFPFHVSAETHFTLESVLCCWFGGSAEWTRGVPFPPPIPWHSLNLGWIIMSHSGGFCGSHFFGKFYFHM